MNQSKSQQRGRIDVHTHVLPAVDDGARDAEEALEMLRIAADDGSAIIAATPHASRTSPAQISRAVAALKQLAERHGIAVTVVPGSEVRFDADLVARHQRGDLVTLNQTPYVLIEMSLRGEWSPYLSRAVSDLQLAGLWPILAHAERYPAVQRDALLLDELIDAGVLIQINADALLGSAGRAARRTAEMLLSGHRAHILASDAHDAHLRPPRLAEAYHRAEALVDAQYLAFVADVPRRVLAGESVMLPEPVEFERDSRRGVLKRLGIRR